MMDTLSYLVIHYGYLAIFILLMLGIFGIPLPDELLAAFSGYLVFSGELHVVPVALAVISGGIFGISLNYLLGRLIGDRVVKQVAGFWPRGPEKLNRVTAWLGRSGAWVLFWTYFFPGLRHWATVGAGITRVPVAAGALCAFPAVAIWSLIFIGLGYHLGAAGVGRLQGILAFCPVLGGAIIVSCLSGYFLIRKMCRPRCCSPPKITP